MSSRRQVLTNGFLAAGAIGGARSAAAAVPAGSSATIAYPRTAAEELSNVVPASLGFAPGDVRRYGILANQPSASPVNTRALKALLAPTGSFAGSLWFPNQTGSDVYHFEDVVPIRDGVHIDLQGCTLEFSKRAEKSDSNSGFLSVLRNFSIQNGSIVVRYDMGGVAGSGGSAIHIGNRGVDSSHFPPTYDSALDEPMGNVSIRNVRIQSNVAKGLAIEMTGGLANVMIDNLSVDGQGSLNGGIYYEFGWSTSGPTDQRETSHAHNMRFTNIMVTNLNKSGGAAVTLTGAYSCVIEGLYVNGAASVFNGTPGESLFYRPHAGVDEAGAKRLIVLRNIVGQNLGSTAITFAGAQLASGGYLGKRNLGMGAQTDLGEYVLDGFVIAGSPKSWGIYVSAGRADIRNGRISGCQRGIVQSDDCTRLLLNSLDVLACTQTALQLQMSGGVWSPPRQKMGEVRNCFIAGNGTQSPGQFPAIVLDNCAGFVFEGNRIGYETTHDGVAESSQGDGIHLGSHCANVVCRGNYVGGVHAGCVGYASDGVATAALETAAGISTTRGRWNTAR
jgi:hypothetical protein